MGIPLKITFNCNNYHLPNYRYVEVDDHAIHYIANLDAFYQALGYSETIHSEGISHDEFIWDIYMKDGSDKSKNCLKKRLIEYLQKNSMEFVDKYGENLSDWLAPCYAKTKKAPECCVHLSPMQGQSA
jgi:hypothetical protein